MGILKKMAGWALCLAAAAALLPAFGATAYADDTYNVWVKGTQVTSANANDVLGDGAASYDPATNTLTVTKSITATGDVNAIKAEYTKLKVIVADGVTISAEKDAIYVEASSSDKDLAVHIEGKATISSYGGSGIYFNNGVGHLSVTGNAGSSLAVSSNKEKSYAIYSVGSVSVSCDALSATADYGIRGWNGPVSVKCGTAYIEAKEEGISAYTEAFKPFSVECDTLTIKTINGCGIRSGKGDVKISGSVSITAGSSGIHSRGGSVSIEGGAAHIKAASYGIDAGSVSVTCGTVGIEANYGVYSAKGTSFDCGSVDVNAKGYGIFAKEGDVSVKCSEALDIAVECPESDHSACGSYHDGIRANDGDVTIQARAAAVTAPFSGIVSFKSLTLGGGSFDVVSTYAASGEETYCALAYNNGLTVGSGMAVAAATEPNGTFEEYVKAKNETYDHVRIGYTVIWKSQDGGSILETDAPVASGAKPSFDREEPAKAAEDGYVYVFEGWATSPDAETGMTAGELPAVSGNVVYYAAFSKAARPVEPTATTSVTVTKKWDAPQGTELPEAVTVILKADGEEILRTALSERNGWTYTFEGLPVNNESDGKAIAYAVDEVDVDGYDTSIEEVDATAGKSFEITNTLKDPAQPGEGNEGGEPNEPGDGDKPGDQDGEEPKKPVTNDGDKSDKEDVLAKTGDDVPFAGLLATVAAAGIAVLVLRRRTA